MCINNYNHKNINHCRDYTVKNNPEKKTGKLLAAVVASILLKKY